MSISITTNDNHTYVIDGLLIDGQRIRSAELSSMQLTDGVINSCMFYAYRGQGAVELLVPGTVVRQVTIKYTEDQLPLWDD